MCGNFGLLQLGTTTPVVFPDVDQVNTFKRPAAFNEIDLLGSSLHESLHEVSRLHGLRVSQRELHCELPSDKTIAIAKPTALSPLLILEAQTASTEIRGGQAGGYSSFEYDDLRKESAVMTTKRVRLVARKRHALAADLAALFKRKGGRVPSEMATFSVIGHTRFATSSVNVVSGKSQSVLVTVFFKLIQSIASPFLINRSSAFLLDNHQCLPTIQSC